VVVLLEHVEQDDCELHTEYGVFCDDSVKAMKLAGEDAQLAGVREGGGSVGETALGDLLENGLSALIP
jgi:hypothetical protein